MCVRLSHVINGIFNLLKPCLLIPIADPHDCLRQAQADNSIFLKHIIHGRPAVLFFAIGGFGHTKIKIQSPFFAST